MSGVYVVELHPLIGFKDEFTLEFPTSEICE